MSGGTVVVTYARKNGNICTEWVGQINEEY